MKQKILQLVKDKPKHYSKMIKCDLVLNEWVLNNTLVESDLYAEMIYSAVYQVANKCPNDNEKKFRNFKEGYGFCGHSSKCQCANDSISKKVSNFKQHYSKEKKQKINQKRIKTTRSKYGVTNNAQTPHAIKKHKEFYSNKENVAKTLSKMQQTTYNNYNVYNPMQNKDIASKSKAKWLSLYGKNYGTLYNEISAKKIATSIQNWNCTHPSKNPDVIAKIIQTNLKKRGVPFPLQNKLVASKASESRLNKKFINNKTKLRFENPKFLNRAVQYFGIQSLASQMHLTELVLRNQLKKLNISIPRSQFEIEIQLFLHQLGITNIQFNTWDILKNREIDVYLPDYNLAIELNGVYWHTEQKNRGKNYHLQKTLDCNKKNIQLLHILDVEWNDAIKCDIWKSMIKTRLKLNDRIYARNCVFKKVPLKEAKEFFNKNHLQGFKGGKIKYGLYYNDELVQCVILGKSRYNKSAEWELIRMASKKNKSIVGGFSKIISHINIPFITYADKRYASGLGYKSIGCTQLNDTPPGYSYLINGDLKSRVEFQKHKLKNKLKIFNAQFSEYENMLLNGFDRIWDCGHMTFIYNKK